MLRFLRRVAVLKVNGLVRFASRLPGNMVTCFSCVFLPHRFCMFSLPLYKDISFLDTESKAEFFEVLVFYSLVLEFSFVRSAYILSQESLPLSYKSFLNKQGGKDLSILQGVKEIACSKPFTNLGAIEKYYKSVGVDIKLNPNMKVPCSVGLHRIFNESAACMVVI